MSSKTVQATSNQSEHHFLRILLAAHITQIALFSTAESIESHQLDESTDNTMGISDEETENLASLVNQLRGKAEMSDLNTNNQKLYLYICSCLMPFMRCVVIFRQYLDLYNIDYLPAEVLESKNCSFKAICQVLDLSPSLCSFFDADGSSLEPQARKWIDAMKSTSSVFGMKYHNIEFPKIVSIPRLVPLPTDYRTVIEDSMMFRCARNTGNLNNSSPAMCLICGATICALSKCCSQSNFSSKPVGGATSHAIKCSKGVGLFMLIRSSNMTYDGRYERRYESCSGVMIAIRKDKICNSIFNLPYLDSHGEPDRGLHQGTQLLMSESAYAELRRQWLGHEIAEKIGRIQSLKNFNDPWEIF